VSVPRPICRALSANELQSRLIDGGTSAFTATRRTPGRNKIDSRGVPAHEGVSRIATTPAWARSTSAVTLPGLI
jgi:hypothetical protein